MGNDENGTRDAICQAKRRNDTCGEAEDGGETKKGGEGKGEGGAGVATAARSCDNYNQRGVNRSDRSAKFCRYWAPFPIGYASHIRDDQISQATLRLEGAPSCCLHMYNGAGWNEASESMEFTFGAMDVLFYKD